VKTLLYFGIHGTLAAASIAAGTLLSWPWLGTVLWIALMAIVFDGAIRTMAREWSRR
jgi:hypothetical protein